MLYIRPLQTDIPVDNAPQVDESNSPKVTCVQCGLEVPLVELRDHQSSDICSLGRPSTSAGTGVEVDCTQNTSPSSSLSSDGKGLKVNCPQNTSTSSSASFAGAGVQVINCRQLISPGSTESSDDTDEVTVEMLRELFPDRPLEILRNAACDNLTLNEAVDEILKGSCESEALTSTANLDLTLPQLLCHFKKQLKEDAEFSVKIERENLWCSLLRVYKQCISNKANLQKKLVVEFKDEEGCDVGALSAEFFYLALNEIRKRLFQGDSTRVLPIKDSSKHMLFHISGIVIAHALLQKGVTFSCLCPALYYYLVGQTDQIAISMCKSDIPLTASTEAVLNLVSELDECISEERLSEILDDDNKLQLISNAHWPVEVWITMKNKGEKLPINWWPEYVELFGDEADPYTNINYF